MAKNYNLNKMSLAKRYEFANPDIQGDTYAGELSLPYLNAALKSNDTIAKGVVRTLDGLTSKAVMIRMSSTALIEGANCDWQNNDDYQTNETVITLNDYQVNQKLCRSTVFPTWIGQGMDRNGNLPQTFEKYLLEFTAAKVAEEYENQLWLGSANGTGFVSNDGTYDDPGITASACGSFSQVDFAAAPTNSTIIGLLEDVYNDALSTNSAMVGKTGFGFYMNTGAYALYAQALAQNTTFQALGSAANFDNLTFMGYPIYVCPGMPDDCIIATYPENLVVASNVGTDVTSVQLIPTYQYDGSDQVRVVMRWAYGVGVGVPTDGVFGSSVHA
jgi:hypothetical protein